MGNRVSVPRAYFDSGGSSRSEFSQLVPTSVTKLLGTITRVYSGTRKAYIRWDCDGRMAEAYMSDLTLEADDIPPQVFSFIIEQNVSNQVFVQSQDEVEDEENFSDHSVDEEDGKASNRVSLRRRKPSKRMYENLSSSSSNESEDDPEAEKIIESLKKKVDQKKKKVQAKKRKRNSLVIKINKKRNKKTQQSTAAPPPSEKDSDPSSESETDTNSDESEDAENVECEDERNWSKDAKKRVSELRYGWRAGEKLVDERALHSRSGEIRRIKPQLKMEAPDIKTILDFFLLFLPLRYFIEKAIPLINDQGNEKYDDWKDIEIGDFIRYLGLRFYQEVVRLPYIRWYWEVSSDGLFPAHNLGRFMSRTQFEQITSCLTLSSDHDNEQQVLDFIDQLNETFQAAITPSSTIVLDESMVKSFHRKMPGKKKIMRKPRPIGVELKILADGATFITLVIEKHGSKESMQGAEYSDEFGATVGCSLRLTKPYRDTGRLVLGDAWFGGVKCVEQLRKNGFFAIMVVKNNHKNFPRSCLSQTVTNDDGDVVGEELVDEELHDVVSGTYSARPLARGEWCSYICPSSQGELVAIRLKDLKDKYLICSAGTTNAGEPRKTLSGKVISRPAAAAEYSQASQAIDVYNHIRTGSVGLEDSWHTSSPKLRQFAALIGFVETNAFLAYQHFHPQGKDMLHRDFRRQLAKVLIENPFLGTNSAVLRRDSLVNIAQTFRVPVVREHSVVRYQDGKQRKCFYCSHAYEKRIEKKTKYYCSLCGPDYPMCDSRLSSQDCFNLHKKNGIPTRQYRKGIE